jgi:hypothetical protein
MLEMVPPRPAHLGIAFASLPIMVSRATSERPRIAFSGVRSSWLRVARNCAFRWLAHSAACLASSSSCLRCFSFVRSEKFSAVPPSLSLRAANRCQQLQIATSRTSLSTEGISRCLAVH